MKKFLLFLLLYAVAATALLLYGYRRHRTEVERLTQNQTTLSARATLYRNQLDEASASVQALRLRCAEFEELRADDAERIRRLGLRLRRLESVATSVATTDLTMQAPLLTETGMTRSAKQHDSIPARLRPGLDTIVPTPPSPRQASLLHRNLQSGCPQPTFGPSDSTRRHFHWHDTWNTVDGIVTADSVLCRVTGVDTLRQIVHRIPHRFLFFRWGTKALRQEISSSNPHTRIVYTEYIRLER